MDSSYYGEGKMGNELRGSSTTSGSRKGKKNNSSSSSSENNNNNKPKQPQRGLGVAQLEKIRLHAHQIASSTFPSNFIHMGLSEYEQTNVRSYTDSQPTNTTSGWEHGNGNMLENRYYSSAHQSNNNITSLPFLNFYDSQDIMESKKHESSNGSVGSSTSTHHSELSNHTHQELDLELRLSL